MAAGPADLTHQREVVEAFLAASRNGDFEALLAVLDPDIVLRADPASVQAAAARRAEGAPVLASEVRGVAAVVGTFAGRARAAQPALIDGAVGAVWAPDGEPRVVFGFTITAGKIVAIDLLSDPELVRGFDVTILGDVPQGGTPESYALPCAALRLVPCSNSAPHGQPERGDPHTVVYICGCICGCTCSAGQRLRYGSCGDLRCRRPVAGLSIATATVVPLPATGARPSRQRPVGAR
jgi:ketosteroid isomerase-like protein